MRTRRVELKTEIDVIFVDQKKAIEYFIEGAFRKIIFCTFRNLDELINYLALMFHQEADRYSVGAENYIREVEGFPPFSKRGEIYTAYSDDTGHIVIIYNHELEHMFNPEPIMEREVNQYKSTLKQLGIPYE
jgi:hypothetical protein